MKKYSGFLLLLFHLFYPISLGVATVMDLEFTLFSEWGFLLILTAVTVGLTCAGAKSAMLFPVTVMDGLCAVWCTRWLPAAVCAVCWCVCGGILFRRAVPKGVKKVLTLIVTVLMIVLLVLSCPLDLFAETMGYVRTVQEADSPDGTYTADLIDSNDGALGGDTLVKVYDNAQTVNLLFGRFTPEPKLIYRGDWGEFDEIELSWEDDHTLDFDGRRYIICSGSGVVDAIFLPQVTSVTVNGTVINDAGWIEDFLTALGRSRATKYGSYYDAPSEEILCCIDFSTGDLFLYEKNGTYYIEQPYQGIWEADKSLIDLLM